jgi:inner membrane protein
MLGRTHVVIAWTVWGAAWWRPPPLGPAAPLVAPAAGGEGGAVVVTLGAIALGAVLPDLDHPRAWLARYRLGGQGSLLGWIRPFALPAWAVHGEFGHRGGLHSLGAAVFVYVLGRALGWLLGAPALGDALAWGYGLHLLADMATRRGIPLFLPLWGQRIRLPRPLTIRTAGLGETVFLAVVVALATAYALSPGA